MRVFIGLELPPRIRRDLASIQTGVPDVRWTPMENMHVTLRFCGEIDGGQAEDLDGELARIDCASFEAALTGAGQFSGSQGLKSLWMGLGPLEPLAALQRKVERACRRAGLPPEGRRFQPHVTLARCRMPPDMHRVRRFLSRHGRFERPGFRVSGFTAWSSELRPDGPIYAREADYPFSDAGLGDSPFFGDWEEGWAPVSPDTPR